MSNVYSAQHRQLQDQFDTRRLADLLEGGFIVKEVDDNNKAFIESRDMFFLSSIDQHGQPTVSYKGGDPGFVKVVDARTIAFPFYDGNGMFYSWGNIAGNPQVGMLFIDFVKPFRLRIQGTARVDMNDELMLEHPEAQGIARVTVESLWPNCPRYVHRYQKVKPARNAKLRSRAGSVSISFSPASLRRIRARPPAPEVCSQLNSGSAK